MTYYTVFVIEFASRRVQIAGSTPHPDEAFVLQAARTVTDADDGCLRGVHFLICDRDTKWSAAVRHAGGDWDSRDPDAVRGAQLQRLC